MGAVHSVSDDVLPAIGSEPHTDGGHTVCR